MCQLFHCFAWALDFIQRLITFFLACFLCGMVCLGSVIALVAGIAYGYNYSLSEFLNLKSPEVTVYMRRGQFYDKPDIEMDKSMYMNRRMGGDDDTFGNKSADYPDTNVGGDAKSLPEAWDQIKDARKYAEALTKFSKKPDEWGQVNQPSEVVPETPSSSTPLAPTLPPPVTQPPIPIMMQQLPVGSHAMVGPPAAANMLVLSTATPGPTVVYLSPRIWDRLRWKTPTRTPNPSKRVFTPPVIPTDNVNESPHILMRNFQSIDPEINELADRQERKEQFSTNDIPDKPDYSTVGDNKERVFNVPTRKLLPIRPDEEAVDEESEDPKQEQARLNIAQWGEPLVVRTSYKTESELAPTTPAFSEDMMDYRDDSESEVDEDNVVYKPV